MAYINDSDITDNVVADLMGLGELSAIKYHTETDGAFNDLAERRGVFEASSISVDDDGFLSNFTCKRWCIEYFSMRMCEDSSFTNSVEILDDDKYDRKAVIHAKKMADLEDKITSSMITGEDSERSERVASSYMMRG